MRSNPLMILSKAVYAKMLEDLDNIITVLGKFGNQSFSSSADRIYNGNTSAWYKFANSLKLRMAMRTCYVAGFNVNGKTSQQLAEEVPVAAGVMTAATDGAYRKVADHNPWQRFYGTMVRCTNFSGFNLLHECIQRSSSRSIL